MQDPARDYAHAFEAVPECAPCSRGFRAALAEMPARADRWLVRAKTRYGNHLSALCRCPREAVKSRGSRRLMTEGARKARQCRSDRRQPVGLSGEGGFT